jgi:hypothetical protein
MTVHIKTRGESVTYLCIHICLSCSGSDSEIEKEPAVVVAVLARSEKQRGDIIDQNGHNDFANFCYISDTTPIN